LGATPRARPVAAGAARTCRDEPCRAFESCRGRGAVAGVAGHLGSHLGPGRDPLPARLQQQRPGLPPLNILELGNDFRIEHTEAVIGILKTPQAVLPPGSAPCVSAIDYAGNSGLAGDNFGSTVRAVSALMRFANQDAINFSWHTGRTMLLPNELVNGQQPPEPLNARRSEGVGLYLDEQAFDLGLLSVAGAGNVPATTGGYPDFEWVASPANGMNILAVGMFDSKSTVTWEDDAVMPNSSWRNPEGLFGGREKPDVVADGRVSSWSSVQSFRGGISSYSGTSFAAPQVAGLAATLGDMFRRRAGPSSPSGAPVTASISNELARALIAASARNNVERIQVPTRLSTFPIVPMGERTGAGGVDALGALYLLNNSKWGFDSVPPACPRGSPSSVLVPLSSARFSLQSGQRARVAMAYSSLPRARNQGIQADFDLVVGQIDPQSGRLMRYVAWAGYRENTLESIGFTSDGAGTYQVYYRNSTIGPCTPPRFIGYAWWDNVP